MQILLDTLIGIGPILLIFVLVTPHFLRDLKSGEFGWKHPDDED